MAIWKEVRCDANFPGCFSGRNEGPKGFESVGHLNAQARRKGWMISGSSAICPNCRAKEEPPA
jgi:hypothetical protein